MATKYPVTIEYPHAAPFALYTGKARVIWEIEVASSTRELSVIAAGEGSRDTDDIDVCGAPGIRIRDLYDGDCDRAEHEAIPLTVTEARQLARALLAAADEYEGFLDPPSVTA